MLAARRRERNDENPLSRVINKTYYTVYRIRRDFGERSCIPLAFAVRVLTPENVTTSFTLTPPQTTAVTAPSAYHNVSAVQRTKRGR